MYSAQGFIRNYDPPSDTVTVELAGLGIIDTWLDGIKIDVGVNRAACVNGAIAILSLPDPHRICEATVSAVPFNPASLAAVVSGGSVPPGGSATTTTYDSGRNLITSAADGTGTVTTNFTKPFPTIPVLSVLFDQPSPGYSIGTITMTAFTISLTAGNPAFLPFNFSWSAHN